MLKRCLPEYMPGLARLNGHPRLDPDSEPPAPNGFAAGWVSPPADPFRGLWLAVGT